MNKCLIFFVLIMSFSIFAKPHEDKSYRGNFRVVLEYSTKINFKKKFVLERANKKILLNGLTLSAKKIILAKKMISYLVMNEYKVITPMRCSAGNYAYTVVKEKLKRVERGCLGTERFSRLVAAFQAI